jgi:hypothetical protein
MIARHHRRDFVRALALGASGATLTTPSPLRAVEAHDEKPKDEVDARMELILARFGARLDAEARKAVRAEVEAIVRRAEGLRRFPLDNGDGPFPVFTPYRAPLE